MILKASLIATAQTHDFFIMGPTNLLLIFYSLFIPMSFLTSSPSFSYCLPLEHSQQA